MRWEDCFEKYTKNGEGEVLDVQMSGTSPVCCAIKHGTGKVIATTGTHILAPKSERKLGYRACRRDEVELGMTLVAKNGELGLVTAIGDKSMRVGVKEYSYQEALELLTLPGGSPCGVKE